MNGRTLTLCRGARLFYQGDLVEVTELAGTTVVLRNDRTSQFTSVQISRLVAEAHPATGRAVSREGAPFGGNLVWAQ